MTTKNIELVGSSHTLTGTSQESVLLSWQGTPIGLVKGAFKVALRGSGTLSIDNPGKKQLHYDVKTKNELLGEPVDDREVPNPAPPQNWLLAMRQRIRNEMGTTREAFAERMSIYEIGDVDSFEEDLIEQKQEEIQPVQEHEPAEPEGTSHTAEISEENN